MKQFSIFNVKPTLALLGMVLVLCICSVAAQGPRTTFNQIQFVIKTGGDDLRGNSSATATLVSPNGTTLQVLTLKEKDKGSWDNNSMHTVLLPLSPSRSAADIGRIVIALQTHNGLGQQDDNWIVDNVIVTLSNSGGPQSPLAYASGSPLQKITKNQPLTVTPQPAGPPGTFNQIQFVIGTGDDDLRADSSATATLQSTNGAVLQQITLKDQRDNRSWDNTTTHSVIQPLNPPRSPAEIGRIVITFESHKHGLENDDNWNVASVAVNLMNNGAGAKQLMSFGDNGMARLTVSKPSLTLSRAPVGPRGTFNQITFVIATGDDDLRDNSSTTARLVSPSGMTLQTVTLKEKDRPKWDNHTTHTVSPTLNPPRSAGEIGQIVIDLETHNGLGQLDDNWNVDKITVALSNNGEGETPLANYWGSPLQKVAPDRSLTLITRRPVTGPPPTADYRLDALPTAGRPVIPDGNDIILYIHGGPGSRLEEAGDLVKPLLNAGTEHGRKYTIVSFDQPSQGYSSVVDPLLVVASHDKVHNAYPLVQFSEDFIAAFIDQLDQVTSIKNRNIYIIGGSLGGALSLRMGHRPDPWIKKIVAWNAASVWANFSDDADPEKGIALHIGFGRATDPEKTRDDDSRKAYFDEGFDKSTPSTQPNPEEWYRGDRDKYPGNHGPFAAEWSCKWDYIAASRLEQQEIYSPLYRQWHWRLGTELLIFSFFNDSWTGPAGDASDSHKPANYETILKPTLLVASEDDDWNEGIFGITIGSSGVGASRQWEDRWTRTRKMAPLMVNTPGYTLYLGNTGHSVHNERPHLFAEEIANFLSKDIGTKGPLQINPEVTPSSDEACQEQLWQFPSIPPELLDHPASANFLLQEARLGGKFIDDKDAGFYSLRLTSELREVAKSKDPTSALANGAVRYVHRDSVLGNAFTDLAVTGRTTYGKFRDHPPADSEIATAAHAILLVEQTASHSGAAVPGANDPSLLSAVHAARTRAYQVAWALRNPDPRQSYELRRTLGWIAVSAEDDPPDRPVNVPSGIPVYGPDGKTQISAYPQYDLPITMPGIHGPVTFQTRYTIANAQDQ